MKELAPGVFQLRGFPPNGINVFLLEDVLIDAATKLAGRRILGDLKGRKVSAHALTHAHPDHQGVSHKVCTTLGIPFWVGERDVAAAEGGPEVIKATQPKIMLNNVIASMWAGPGHPVDRVLREGDEVAGFRVIDAPGHSPGQVAYWRESDRVLVLGDVVNTMNLLTTRPGLQEPPRPFTPDPVTNRASIRKLAELQPALVLAGHGPPWRDTQAFTDFAGSLSTD